MIFVLVILALLWSAACFCAGAFFERLQYLRGKRPSDA